VLLSPLVKVIILELIEAVVKKELVDIVEIELLIANVDPFWLIVIPGPAAKLT
jgi:hypothetical protein